MTSRPSRMAHGAVATISSAALLALGVAAPASALPVEPERVSGDTRFGTSAAIAEKFFTGLNPTFPVVVVASGLDYADALAGAPAAASGEAPLLLTGATLSDEIDEQLTRLKPGGIIVLGGPRAVSDEVVEKLNAHLPGANEAVRLAGENRFETAVKISESAFPQGADTVFIASGSSFADALAGAPAAAGQDAPLLLVNTDTIPKVVEDELAALDPSEIYVLGGTSAVSEGVETALGEYGKVTRLAGADRYETSVAIASKFPGGDTVVVASGFDFPDALSIAPPAGMLSAPILLTAPDKVPASVAAKYKAINPSRTIVPGGPAAVSDAVLTFLANPS